MEGLAVDEPDMQSPAEYILQLDDGSDGHLLSSKSLWRAVVRDLRGDVSTPAIAARFHAGVARGFMDAALSVRRELGITQVALSGGCMHNRRLARLLREGLEREGFSVYAHRKVSPGDGGLSYGQAVVAAARLRTGT
jgi:hydrogenase maturation protein HypF